MASKKDSGALRGAKLVKKALATANTSLSPSPIARKRLCSRGVKRYRSDQRMRDSRSMSELLMSEPRMVLSRIRLRREERRPVSVP